MDKGENCPVCSELGRSGILQLRNINDSEAIYVCNNTECPFPVGLSDKIAENVIPSLLPESEQDQEEREASDQEGEWFTCILVVYDILPLCTHKREQLMYYKWLVIWFFFFSMQRVRTRLKLNSLRTGL